MPRFLCDGTLKGLGRWLRATGYDTVIATDGLPDRVIAARCAEEDRVLLTRDRQLAATVSGIAPVVLLPGNGIDETARALRIALDIDWQYTPFTRCLVDNCRRPIPVSADRTTPMAGMPARKATLLDNCALLLARDGLCWREMDSNFQYAGAVNLVVSPFGRVVLCDRVRSGRSASGTVRISDGAGRS